MAREGKVSKDAAVGDCSSLLASTLQGRNKEMETRGEKALRALRFLYRNH